VDYLTGKNNARGWDCMLDPATDGVSVMNLSNDFDDQVIRAIGPTSDSNARDTSMRKVGTSIFLTFLAF
jgi:hypothetical protein